MDLIKDILGGSGGFFFEPLTDVLDVAPENSSRLLHIAPQQKNDGADTSDRDDEIGQTHLCFKTLNPL